MKPENTKKNQTLEDLIQTSEFVEHVSVDCVIFGFDREKQRLKVILLKYHDLDLWSLPGGFVFKEEDLREAAVRVLYERTNLKNLFLNQFHTFGRINRTENNTHQILLQNKGIEVSKDHWIFQRFISVGYCSLIDYTLVETFPDSLNEVCEWFYVDDLPPLAFDHQRIIDIGLKHLRKNLDTQLVAYKLLPEKFTMNDLQNLYEIVLGEKFRRNNFQRKMLSLNTLERLEKFYSGSANKAPYLYRFKESEINFLD